MKALHYSERSYPALLERANAIGAGRRVRGLAAEGQVSQKRLRCAGDAPPDARMVHA